MRRRLFAGLLVLGLLALVVLAWTGDGPPPQRGVVESVIDGDTVRVRAGGRTLDVRLLGIDTPETVHPQRPVECFGPQASRFTRRMLEGASVRLEYDRELRDRFGRWLAYVYVERPGHAPVFANARLVAGGYARTLSILPNTLHAEELEALEREAALEGRGLWTVCG